MWKKVKKKNKGEITHKIYVYIVKNNLQFEKENEMNKMKDGVSMCVGMCICVSIKKEIKPKQAARTKL